MLVVFGFAVFAGFSGLEAQTLTTGALAGKIRSPNGEPLTEVLVTTTDLTTGITRSVTTDFTGGFELRQLPPAEYELVAERLGFRPVRVTGLPVRAGQRSPVTIVLAPAAPPVDSVEVIRYSGGAATATRPGVSEFFPQFSLRGLPFVRGELTELLRLSSVADPELTIEGLPARFNVLAMDATRYAPAWPGVSPGAAAFPTNMFESAELLTNAVDVEWSGFTGGVLNGFTRRGGREFRGEVFADWGGDMGSSAETFDATAESFTNVQGGAFLSGPFSGDSARFAIGLFGRRHETPQAPLWQNTAQANAVIASARDNFGLDLGGLVAPSVARTDALTAFGRVDWQVAPGHALDLHVSYAGIPETSASPSFAGPLSIVTPLKASDVVVGATLYSSLGASAVNELRLGLASSSAEFDEEAADLADVASTFVIPESLFFGADALRPHRSLRNSLQISDAIHFQVGSHQLKLGAAFDAQSVEEAQRPGDRVTVYFGGASQLAARQGVAVQVDPLADAEFSTSLLAGFLQDTWRPQEGLEITAGVRYELESLPSDEVILNTEWARLTGLDNSAIASSKSRISPRVSASWNVDGQHTWIFRAAGGIYYDRFDPALFSEVITNDGTNVRRYVGALNWWPQGAAPDTGRVAPALSLLAPEFQSPRSTRASFGITRSLGRDGALHLAASMRETKNLPRRVDLNRSTTPLAHDQHGRPIYGALVQQGGLIVAQPGTNRRFDGFDLVHAINADGTSQYQALSAMLEWSVTDELGVVARYTYSNATDDWLGANVYGGMFGIDPGLDAQLAGDWADATSDFDAPHRVAVAGELNVVSGIKLAGVYRYRSGYPFTPGFPVGVDVNGDGAANNDPAFIDTGIAGAGEIVASWDCLRSQAGRFAERNSCRSDGVHSLDGRLSISLSSFGLGPVELRLDAFNVLQSDAGVVDNAFYRIDPAGQLTNNGSGTVLLPLTANPDFGKTRVPLVPARLLRLGIQLKW